MRELLYRSGPVVAQAIANIEKQHQSLQNQPLQLKPRQQALWNGPGKDQEREGRPDPVREQKFEFKQTESTRKLASSSTNSSKNNSSCLEAAEQEAPKRSQPQNVAHLENDRLPFYTEEKNRADRKVVSKGYELEEDNENSDFTKKFENCKEECSEVKTHRNDQKEDLEEYRGDHREYQEKHRIQDNQEKYRIQNKSDKYQIQQNQRKHCVEENQETHYIQENQFKNQIEENREKHRTQENRERQRIEKYHQIQENQEKRQLQLEDNRDNYRIPGNPRIQDNRDNHRIQEQETPPKHPQTPLNPTEALYRNQVLSRKDILHHKTTSQTNQGSTSKPTDKSSFLPNNPNNKTSEKQDTYRLLNQDSPNQYSKIQDSKNSDSINQDVRYSQKSIIKLTQDQIEHRILEELKEKEARKTSRRANNSSSNEHPEFDIIKETQDIFEEAVKNFDLTAEEVSKFVNNGRKNDENGCLVLKNEFKRCDAQSESCVGDKINKSVRTENTSVKAGNTSVKPGSSSVKTGNTTVKGENTSAKTGNTSVKTGNTSFKAGNNQESEKLCGTNQFGITDKLSENTRFGVTDKLSENTDKWTENTQFSVADKFSEIQNKSGKFSGADKLETEKYSGKYSSSQRDFESSSEEDSSSEESDSDDSSEKELLINEGLETITEEERLTASSSGNFIWN